MTKGVHGFDIYLQVPIEAGTASPEQFLAGAIPALIQVKGTMRERISVELRVWRKLLEAPCPSFFLIYQYADRSSLQPKRVVLLHLSGKLLEAAAARIWKADAGEGARAGQTMDLVWDEVDELSPPTASTLVDRLRTAIGEPSRYVRSKLAARESAGRGERPFKFHVRRSGPSLFEIDRQAAEFAVGLRAELPLDLVYAFEERFGVKRSLTGTSSADGAVLSWPGDEPPMEACTLILVDTVSGEELTLHARVAVSVRVSPGLGRMRR
ncbi:MAG: hypothetical protein MUE69_33475 [Myxococcota bacterium]|nr:hypothetical protein [Myxococcota bacterium]